MKEGNGSNETMGPLAKLIERRVLTQRQRRFFAGFIRALERMQAKRIRYS